MFWVKSVLTRGEEILCSRDGVCMPVWRLKFSWSNKKKLVKAPPKLQYTHDFTFLDGKKKKNSTQKGLPNMPKSCMIEVISKFTHFDSNFILFLLRIVLSQVKFVLGLST